jgi:hypothetical protein
MGHKNFQGLHELLKERRSTGIPYIPVTLDCYDQCVFGEHHKEIVPKTNT